MTDIAQFRARQIEQGELWEELKPDLAWFHIVRGLVMRGAVAEMGVNAWAVYCIIKGHSNMETGVAFPSVETIGELAGFSPDTANRALKVLLERGLIAVSKHGRKNHYRIKEHIPLLHPDGQPFAISEHAYASKYFGEVVKEIKRFAETGNIPGNNNITINLTLNVQNINQRDGGTVTMNVQQVHANGPNGQPLQNSGAMMERLKNVKV